jgi:hypothetical protein
MRCPTCGLINPDDAVRCGCGYIFTMQTEKQPWEHKFYRSYTDMGVKEFFSNSWGTFGANWNTFLILAAIPTGLSSALVLSTEPKAVIVITIINHIVWILTIMALTMAAHKTSDGEAMGVWESYSSSFGLFWRYIWAGILYFLIVLGGFFLFIIPGIIWAVRYVFAPYAVIVEGVGGGAALSRSKAITKDRCGSIFLLELGFGFLFFLVIVIPMTLLILLVGLALGKPFVGFSTPSPEWAQTIWFFGNIVSEGLFVIFNVLLFKSLRSLDNSLEEIGWKQAE